jgi:hypothetical protein
MKLRIEIFFSESYMGLWVSLVLATPISTLTVLPPIKPNTKINISGNNKVNTTDDGLRTMDLKLALAMAMVALKLLYGFSFIGSFVCLTPALSKGEGVEKQLIFYYTSFLSPLLWRGLGEAYPSRHSFPVRFMNTSSRLASFTSFGRSKPEATSLSIKLSGVSISITLPPSTNATRSQSISASSM